MIDVATGWSERVAVLGRSYLVMEDAFQSHSGPSSFPGAARSTPTTAASSSTTTCFASGTDSNPKPQLSRSRPYHKNDNRFVEQKNSTLVRAYLGYDRLDTVAQTLAVNQLYDKMWLYYNFFQPVMRLTEKTWIREEGQPSRVKRRYDQARTPFDRLCATKAIPQEQREQLRPSETKPTLVNCARRSTNSIDHIFSLPGAVPGRDRRRSTEP